MSTFCDCFAIAPSQNWKELHEVDRNPAGRLHQANSLLLVGLAPLQIPAFVGSEPSAAGMLGQVALGGDMLMRAGL